jgi:hypothetical protein
MSLVDFFFNANYRESLQSNCSTKLPETNIETKDQKNRRLKKFYRDYHLNSMRHEVKLLNSEIIYGFINKKDVTFDKFKKFLEKRNAKSWEINVLWKEFNT